METSKNSHSEEELEKIRQEIMDETRIAMDKAGLKPDSIAKELKPLVLSDIGQLFTKKGDELLSISKIRKHSKIIKKVRQKKRTYADKSIETIIEVELYDKHAAIRTAAEMRGMVVEKVEHDVKVRPLVIIDGTRSAPKIEI